MALRTSIALALLVGCTRSAVLADPADAGALPEDAGDAARDLGARPEVCAAAAAGAPLGILALRREGTALHALHAGGRTSVLHRALEDVAARGEPTWSGPRFAPGLQGRPAGEPRVDAPVIAASLVTVEERCGGSRCPRQSELVLLTPDGIVSRRLSFPASFRAPQLTYLTNDGLVGLQVGTEAIGGFSEARFYDARGAQVGVLDPGVHFARDGHAGADGWRAASFSDDAGSGGGFLRFRDGRVETRRPGVEGSVWRDAWVVWDDAGVHVQRADSRRTIPLALDVGGGRRTPQLAWPRSEVLLLSAGRFLYGLVALARERATLFPEPLPHDWSSRADLSVGHGVARGSVDGAPRHRVTLDTGAVVPVALPEGLMPLVAGSCTGRPQPVAGGGFALVLRGEERTGGYVARGSPPRSLDPVGLRLRDVAFGQVLPAGPLLVVMGSTGRDRFCPAVEPSDAPAAADERVGDSVQIVGADGAQLLAPDESVVGYLDPDGACALVGDPRALDAGLWLRDFTRGEDAEVEGTGWFPVDTLPLFFY